MDKEIIYKKLNEVLDLIESRRVYDAQTQLEGLLNEIKYGIYDK
jgi:hypothetical protein